jgi:hypothetical protein
MVNMHMYLQNTQVFNKYSSFYTQVYCTYLHYTWVQTVHQHTQEYTTHKNKQYNKLSTETVPFQAFFWFDSNMFPL